MKTSPLALAAVVALTALPSLARELGGVDLPETLNVEGKTLHLNGAGIRKKFIIKVYVGGLYLQAPATSLAAIVSPDQPWSIHMHFVRSVDKDKIVNAFREGFEKNSKEKLAVLNPGLDKVAPAIPAEIQKGSDLVMTYVPGKGTSLGIAGGSSLTVEGKDFADAILRNWLGNEPADESLKSAMLSGGK